jgi:hypothetical protein
VTTVTTSRSSSESSHSSAAPLLYASGMRPQLQPPMAAALAAMQQQQQQPGPVLYPVLDVDVLTRLSPLTQLSKFELHLPQQPPHGTYIWDLGSVVVQAVAGCMPFSKQTGALTAFASATLLFGVHHMPRRQYKQAVCQHKQHVKALRSNPCMQCAVPPGAECFSNSLATQQSITMAWPLAEPALDCLCFCCCCCCCCCSAVAGLSMTPFALAHLSVTWTALTSLSLQVPAPGPQAVAAAAAAAAAAGGGEAEDLAAAVRNDAAAQLFVALGSLSCLQHLSMTMTGEVWARLASLPARVH